jgi:hypothetical protein
MRLGDVMILFVLQTGVLQTAVVLCFVPMGRVSRNVIEITAVH